ncbi:glycosyltransferase family 2 protein [Haloflavibacter putidus]|uniref:Glycosyltransferase family 2 protein n=1 Tax=Haloflavibacter putidus TaxID=2576776 RepID=A0A507ZJW3_9FLAO|nr:glycosyltransferase family 2 protein [Haloflavibacter putidus]TQD34012.1 glycosyltransferase family 2 protein [Haloflavibacter putidus]
MKTAVVILNWNGKALLEKFLPSVVKYSPEASIYVADNASTDASVAFVKDQFSSVKLICLAKNGGYAKGYNQALAQLEEDIFILLNSDVEVTQNWLIPIIAAFKEDLQLGAAQPKLLDHKNKAYFEYAGAAGGFIDRLGYPFCRGRIFDTIEKDKGQYNDTCEIFWASGACLAIRKNVFEQAGKLDEDYFAHQEEIDLCWRVKNLGYRVVYLGNSTVYHVGGATLHAMHPKKTYLNFRNSLYNLLKNTPGNKVWLYIFLRMLLDGLAGIKFLIDRKPRHFLAILKAHASFYGNFTLFLKKRKTYNNKHIQPAFKAIVIAYYLYKKRYFEQLSSKP